jgi:membrane protein DedA with SNARE-associated domain
MAAVLAGTNSMAQRTFYFASAIAAAAWIICYGLAARRSQMSLHRGLGLAAVLIVLAVPALILRYEKRLLAEAELLPRASLGIHTCR